MSELQFALEPVKRYCQIIDRYESIMMTDLEQHLRERSNFELQVAKSAVTIAACTYQHY